jgi:DNA-binding response OmpR family regulator
VADRRFQLLVVDDDPALRGTLAALLQLEGYDVTVADSLEAGQRAAQTLPDLVLLDLRLGSGKSYDFGRWLGGRGVPFLMLSGETSSLEKVLTLELGAEDYITKPFDEAELFARIRVILRRQGSPQGAVQDQLIGNARLRVERRALERQGETIPLTEQEFHLLTTFLRHPQEVLRREVLARDSGSQPLGAGQRHIDVAVGKLRQKLGPGSIVAVRGQGYQLVLPVASPSGARPAR